MDKNSHFAVANVNYTLEAMHERKAAGIARDNKALVYIDIEVVHRPSKSWSKSSMKITTGRKTSIEH